MKDPELDRILSTEQEIVPSANFARNVMDKVRMEASTPPPIPFPWKRALPGLILCVLAVVAVLVTAVLRPGPQRVPEVSGLSIWMRLWLDLWPGLSELLRAINAGGWGWIFLALLLTFVSVKLSLRVAGRRV
jgi:hypothetical protein